jgi:hypothetical protein
MLGTFSVEGSGTSRQVQKLLDFHPRSELYPQCDPLPADFKPKTKAHSTASNTAE